MRTLLEYQTEDYPDEEIKAQQAKLNALYDAFTRKDVYKRQHDDQIPLPVFRQENRLGRFAAQISDLVVALTDRSRRTYIHSDTPF